MNENKLATGEITDSARDIVELKQDANIINLPDVRDIPGQEHILPPRFAQFADTTISSADEEADDLFADEALENDSNVGTLEGILLQRTDESMSTDEDQSVFNAELDDTDNEGDLLNEATDTDGDDLDVPGTEEDEGAKAEGDEDEENEEYSLGGDDHE